MSVALVLGTVVWESGAQSSVRAGRLENNACFSLLLASSKIQVREALYGTWVKRESRCSLRVRNSRIIDPALASTDL